MEVNQMLVMNDNYHKAFVTKVLSNESFVIECNSKNLTFTRLIENDDFIKYGLPVYSWEKYFIGIFKKIKDDI
jgi:hypothetical protein